MYGAVIGDGMAVIFNSPNNMKNILLIIAILFFLGCSTKTQFIESDGSIFTVKSGSDSLVIMKDKDREITVDNRGKPNIFESLLGWMLLKTPEINKAK